MNLNRASLFLFAIPFALAACGGHTSPAPDPAPPPPPPAPQGLPAGDCHATPGAPAQVFTPAARTTTDVPGSELIVFGDQVYAALLGAQGPSEDQRIWVGAGTSAWQTYVAIPDPSDVVGRIVAGKDRIYWPATISRGEWQVPVVRLGYRAEDGSVATVPGTELNYDLRAYAIHGDTAFTFYCPEGGPSNAPCGAPGASWTLAATQLGSGARVWTQTVAASDVDLFSRMVADDAYVYWSTPAGAISRVPSAGGEATSVPVPLGASEQVVDMVRSNDALFVAALGPRDGAMTNEIALYRLPIAGDGFGHATRLSLGRTYEEGLAVALDDASVYFAYDAPGAIADETRTLARACLDGTNRVTLVSGRRFGEYSIQNVAVGDRRVFFTAQNRVYALDK